MYIYPVFKFESLGKIKDFNVELGKPLENYDPEKYKDLLKTETKVLLSVDKIDIENLRWYWQQNRSYKPGYGLLQKLHMYSDMQNIKKMNQEIFREITILGMWADLRNLVTFNQMNNELRMYKPYKWAQSWVELTTRGWNK